MSETSVGLAGLARFSHRITGLIGFEEAVDAALSLLRASPLGTDAVLLGEVRAEPGGLVLLDTALGGTRIVDMLVGDPLPRIC